MLSVLRALLRLLVGTMALFGLIEWCSFATLAFPLTLWLGLGGCALLCWLLTIQVQAISVLRRAALPVSPVCLIRVSFRALRDKLWASSRLYGLFILVALLLTAAMDWAAGWSFPWLLLFRLSIMFAVFLLASAWVGRSFEEPLLEDLVTNEHSQTGSR